MPVRKVKADLTNGGYRVSDGAKRYAEKALGLDRKALSDLLDSSVKVSNNEYGNYRTREFFFRIEKGEVLAIKKANGFIAAEPLDKHPSPTQAKESSEEPAEVIREVRGQHGGCPYCGGSHRQLVWNECERCEGKGCNRCKEGLVKASIPCQTCVPKKGRK